MTAFVLIVRRDVQLSLRQGGAVVLAVAFFVLAVVLFPLGVGPELEILRRISAGVVWVAALLAALVSVCCSICSGRLKRRGRSWTMATTHSSSLAVLLY